MRRPSLEEPGVDLNRFVAGMLTPLHHRLGGKAELQTGFTAGLPPVRVDRQELERTLLELVLGALGTLPEGGRLILMTGRSSVGAFLRVEDAAGGSGVTVSLPAA